MNAAESNAASRIAVCLVLIASAIANSQTVTATVDRKTIDVADPFTLTISVTAPHGSKVQYIQLAEKTGAFQILSTKDLFDIPVGSERTWTRIYELETYESGELEVPSQTVIVNQQSLKTDAIPLQVRSLVEQQADLYTFRDLKDLEEIPVEQPGTSNLVWIGLGTVVLAWLAWALLARTKNQQLSPSQWARARLDKLKESSEYARGIPTQILPELTDILREYIQRNFEISATRQTTMEFIRAAQTDTRLNNQQRAELRQLLEHVDQIKFAHLVPEDNRSDETFAQIESFIESTTGQPQVSDEVA